MTDSSLWRAAPDEPACSSSPRARVSRAGRTRTRQAALTLLVCFAPLTAACQRDAAPADADARPALGYTPAAIAAERALESRFRGLVRAEQLSTLHGPLTRRPHPAGSPGSEEVITYLKETLSGFGLDVMTHEYQVLQARPRRVAIEMTAPARRALGVTEPALADDPTSSHPELGGGYVAYSASGDASGQIVYVNYGLPPDYAELERLGVSVKGRIALARYGRSHRAVKTYTAEQAGARALILYSDPGDDGQAKGPAWPHGYWRGEHMLQRGNAKYSWFWHGDPLTPGVAATDGAARLPEATAPTLPRIPVVVVSAAQAQVLMAALAGPEGPAAFRGGWTTPYHVGPGPAAVALTVEMDQAVRPITNVVATLRGTSTPQRTIMLGTHHDAWTFGGVDPGTGAAAVLEVARVVGELARGGWRPARSIAFAFWDAEELGLVGSTEYAEQFASRLRDELVLYLNIDMYMKGRFDPGGVPSLSPFVADVTRDVPQGTSTVFDEWKASELRRAAAAGRSIAAADFVPDLEALGSGADFVPFQDHLAVPTMAIEFIGENGYGFGTYHSNYDSRAYVERIADPGFQQGVLMAQTLGSLVLRMAGADVLPFRFSHYVAKLQTALADAESWSAEAGVAFDPSPLRLSAAKALVAARTLEEAVDGGLAEGRLTRDTAAALNDRLARMEQTLADDDGAADRAWYRHVFYGWNIYSLYDGQPFPGLAEAFRVRDRERVAHETGRIQRALDRMHAELAAARDLAGR